MLLMYATLKSTVRNSTRLAVLVAAFVIAGLLHRTTAMAATIVEDGQSKATIVLEQNPKGATRDAVNDLVNYIEQISGARVNVVESGTRVTTPVTIWIGGDHPSLKSQFPLNFTKYEQMLIVCRGGDILIAGNDAKNGGLVWQEGTAAAIYVFLEKYLGVRWFWPGDLGTDVPKQPTITMESTTYEYAPPFKQRHLRTQHYAKSIKGYTGEYRNVEQLVDGLSNEMYDWRRRQRAGQRFIVANHAFTTWWEQYHDKHPDYFALQPDGTRSLVSKPDRVKLCISNPDVTKQWFANAVDVLDKKSYTFSASASPNDNEYEGYCTCPKCEAMDAKSGPMVRLQWKGKKAEHVALTDRYARWWNQLGKALKARYPNREVYVGVWGYGAYRTPPVEVKLENNIVLGYIGGFPAYSKARREEERANWLGWAKQIDNMVWRPNLFYYDRGMPLVFTSRAAEDFNWLSEHKMMGLDMDTIYGHWAIQGLQYYQLAKLSWDPHLSNDEFMTDYTTRAFGKESASYMRTYYEKLEEIFYAKCESDADSGLERIAELPTLYSPARLNALQKLLDDARNAVAEGEKADVYRQRIDFVQTGLDFTKLHIASIDAMNDLRMAKGNRKAAYERALEAGQKRNAFLDAQMESHSLNTVEGFNNWVANDNLRAYFGPPDESMLRN